MAGKYSIILEDNYLLVINKPSGLLVVPTPRNERHTLTNLLNRMLRQRGEQQKVYPCHRLDRDTSGLIIYAKDLMILKNMEQAFKERKVKKKYLAYVRGCPLRKQGSITYRLEGQPARTNYRLLQKHRGFSVMEAEPITGRTNQIRIHFKKIGHPLLGERKYAFGKDFPVKFPRLALHASQLEFTHPITGKVISFRCDRPTDMDLQRVKYKS